METKLFNSKQTVVPEALSFLLFVPEIRYFCKNKLWSLFWSLIKNNLFMKVFILLVSILQWNIYRQKLRVLPLSPLWRDFLYEPVLCSIVTKHWGPHPKHFIPLLLFALLFIFIFSPFSPRDNVTLLIDLKLTFFFVL